MRFSRTWIEEYRAVNTYMRKLKITKPEAKDVVLCDIAKQCPQLSPEVAPLYMYNLAEEFNGGIPNIFFESVPLKKFLKECKINSIDGIKEHLLQHGKVYTVGRHKYIDNEVIERGEVPPEELMQCYILSYNIHIPNEEYGYTFCYDYSKELNQLLVWVKCEEVGSAYFATLGDDNSELSVKSLYKQNEHAMVENVSFALNFLFYILCFPEMLVDGLWCKAKDMIASNKMTLKTSPKVLHDSIEAVGTANTKGTKCPHFRTGYFRHLTSDFYKAKQGQFVFVKSCVVNGSSVKTCLSIDKD